MAFRHLLASIVVIVSFTTSAKAPADYQAGLVAYSVGDYQTALGQWRRLAEDGSTQAQFNLAYMYDNGQGVPHDYTEAARWYLAAAEQGHPEAAWNLGMMYTAGQGVSRDYVEAYKWLSLSAQMGDKRIHQDRMAVAGLLTEDQLEKAEAWVRSWRLR